MTKFFTYCMATMLFLFAATNFVSAQTVQIGTGTQAPLTNGAIYSPICKFSGTGNPFSRCNILYTAAELSGQGITTGASIEKLAFYKIGTGSSTAPFSLKIYIRNSTTTAPLVVGTAWSTIVSSYSLCYSTTTQNISAATGWVEFPLTTSFIYTGGNIEIALDSESPSGSTGSYDWQYTPGFADYILGYVGSSAGATLSGTVTNYKQRANIQITYIPGSPCTTPPTAGNAVSNKTNVCAGENFNLSLSGNSSGSGQTYQWQKGNTATGPWTDIGSLSTSPSYNAATQFGSSFYRCNVICNGNSQYSSAVEVTSPSLINGTFTINNAQPTGGSNFHSFADAVSFISCGINGPVIFNVASGTYNEQVTISQIGGTSTTNTITFNGNGATLDFSALATTALRSGITLNGADHIIIDSLNINGSNGTFAWGIILTNQADSNIIRKCTINIGNLTSTSTNFMGVVLNGSTTATATSGNNGNGNLFDRNTILGGYYGFYVYGSSSASNLDNKFTNNIVQDMYASGVYMLYQNNTLVSKNDFSRPTRTTSTTVAGVQISTTCAGVLIEKNRIHNLFDALPTNTSAAYPIYIGTSGTAALVNRVENNLIYNINSATSGTIYGIYGTATSYSYWNVYHNTIILDYATTTTGTTYGIYLYGAAGVNIKNNIVVIGRAGTGTKYCLYYSTVGVASSNNNVLINNSTGGTTNSIGYFNAGSATLAAWQAANSAVYDQQSTGADPLFLNSASGDYTPSAVAVNDIGSNVGVTTDILDIARSSNPDPGAYEFSLGACTNPPTPGTAITSQGITCSGIQFTLDLIGNSVGAGQTYQWQSSPNDLAPWTDVGAASTVANLITSQTSSKYYRCAIKCGTGAVVYSTSVLVNTPAAVSGIFNINGTQPTGGSNFQTFAEAINYIKCSIGGPVVFNVAPGTGPYNEQVIIPQISGTSSINTVTINGNGETLTYTSTNTAERAVLKLNGADYFIINNLHIIAPGAAATEYGYGVQLVNDADSNTIANCVIDITQAPATAASTSFAGIVVNAAAATSPIGTGDSKCDKNTFINNTITGGYVGISLTANGATNVINSNKVLRNSINEFYTYGIYANGNNNLLVDSNEVSRPTRSSVNTFNGIYFTGVSTNSTVSRNRVHDPFGGAMASTTAAFAIYFTGCDATAGNENIVANNLVYNMFGGTGNHNGFLNSSSDYVKVYHNTFSLDDISASPSCATCNARAIYIATTTVAGLDIRNNIASVSRNGTGEKQGIYFEPTSVSSYTLDNNNYFMNGSGGIQEVGHIGTTGYATLAAWQTGTSKEANSKDMDPLFANIATGDFKPLSSVIDNMGVPVGITTDINGAARSLATPDAGAYEFSNFTAGVNMGAEALVSPAVSAAGCYGSAETVTVRIRNSSASAHNFVTNPVTVNINVTGAVVQNFNVVVNTGTLASSGTLNVSVPTPLNMSTPGTYTFNASTSLTGDANTSNDAMGTANRTKVSLDAGAVVANPPGYCTTGSTPTLTATTAATGNTGIQWQQSTTTGTGFTNIPGAVASPYTVGTAITQTMYYRLNAVCGTAIASSAETVVMVSNPQIVGTTPRTRCGAGVVNLGAAASAGATVNWYDAPTGGNLLTTGNSYTTPSIAANTTYYVSATGGSSSQSFHVGYTSTANYSFLSQNVGWGFMFTANTNCTLETVTVYPTGTGTISIKVLDVSNNILFSGPVTNITGTGASTPVVVPVGAILTPGNYKLGMASTGVTNLGSQATGGTFAYPFVSVPLTITSGSQGTGAVAGVYYWLYDWVVSTGSVCESSPRTAVVAAVDNTPGCSAVPITLLNFKGEKQGAINKLEWTTSTEINNAGFELQRSADGVNFSQLAYVASKAINGNSNSQLAYSINDVKPLLGNGYYRLKQVDKDGKSSHSSIVLLKGSKPTSLAISSVYPNPSVKELNMVLLSPIADDVKIVVTDITGKILLQKAVTVAQGDNKVQLNVQSLSQGTYIVKAVCSNGCETAVHRFVKQ